MAIYNGTGCKMPVLTQKNGPCATFELQRNPRKIGSWMIDEDERIKRMEVPLVIQLIKRNGERTST